MISPNDPTRSGSAPEFCDAAYVRLSLSEINALCFKAARGAGLCWGEAEEAGWAAAWLSRAGLAGPGILRDWLEESASLSRPMPAAGRWPMGARPLCPLRTGIALADHAGLAEGPGVEPLCVEAVSHPRIVLPFVARAATRLGHPLRIGWPGVQVTLEAGQDGPITGASGDESAGPASLWIDPVAVRQTDRKQDERAVPLTPIALADWQALDALALRVTVPPSAQSRAGAGAAEDDND